MQTEVITGSRVKAVMFLFLTAIFVAGGIWLVLTGDADAQRAGWVSIALFGVPGLPIFGAQIFRPARLELSAGGLTIKPSIGKARVLHWNEIERFFVWQNRGNRFVAYMYQPDHRPSTPLANLSKSFGADGLLGTSWQLSADKMAAKLEERRLAAGGL